MAEPDATPPDASPPDVSGDLARAGAFVRRLGSALLRAQRPTSEVRAALLDVARAYALPRPSVLVLPTGVLVRWGSVDDDDAVADLGDASGPPLRLDQAGAVDALAREAARGRLPAAEANRRLEGVLAAPPRFGLPARLLGHVVLTLGFGLLLNPTAAALPAYAALGLLVGLLRVVGSHLTTVDVGLPVVAAAVVTFLVVREVAPALGEDPVRVATPPLVSFLPGATLTVATIELARDEVVAGASRLVYGLSRLFLLGFGVLVGVGLAGPVEGDGGVVQQLGGWAPFAGVLLVGLGYTLFSSAPRGSLPWIVAALYAAYLAQAVGGTTLGPTLAAFVGGLVIVPVSEVLARLPHGPPAQVTMLPAFWLLVPGALGFAGISHLVGEDPEALEQVAQTLVTLFAIGTGVLVGSAMTSDVLRVRRSLRSRAG